MSGETSVENRPVGSIIKSAKKEARLVVGAKSVKKGIKNKSIDAVICSSTCPQGYKKDILKDSETFSFEVIEFDDDSSRLGELCGKHFNVSVLGIKKAEPQKAKGALKSA
jgi:ribosomal protein L30E